jgi:putative holliday junction resolvase
MPATPKAILALDVGSRRIGVAVASLPARLPRPLITLERDDSLFPALQNIAEVEGAIALIVGFPRGMQGQRTAQTTAIEEFTDELRRHFALPVHFQDESLTSKHAEDELRARGRPYDRGDIDALAATYILEDWLHEQRTSLKERHG